MFGFILVLMFCTFSKGCKHFTRRQFDEMCNNLDSHLKIGINDLKELGDFLKHCAQSMNIPIEMLMNELDPRRLGNSIVLVGIRLHLGLELNERENKVWSWGGSSTDSVLPSELDRIIKLCQSLHFESDPKLYQAKLNELTRLYAEAKALYEKKVLEFETKNHNSPEYQNENSAAGLKRRGEPIFTRISNFLAAAHNNRTRLLPTNYLNIKEHLKDLHSFMLDELIYKDIGYRKEAQEAFKEGLSDLRQNLQDFVNRWFQKDDNSNNRPPFVGSGGGSGSGSNSSGSGSINGTEPLPKITFLLEIQALILHLEREAFWLICTLNMMVHDIMYESSYGNMSNNITKFGNLISGAIHGLGEVFPGHITDGIFDPIMKVLDRNRDFCELLEKMKQQAQRNPNNLREEPSHDPSQDGDVYDLNKSLGLIRTRQRAFGLITSSNGLFSTLILGPMIQHEQDHSSTTEMANTEKDKSNQQPNPFRGNNENPPNNGGGNGDGERKPVDSLSENYRYNSSINLLPVHYLNYMNDYVDSVDYDCYVRSEERKIDLILLLHNLVNPQTDPYRTPIVPAISPESVESLDLGVVKYSFAEPNKVLLRESGGFIQIPNVSFAWTKARKKPVCKGNVFRWKTDYRATGYFAIMLWILRALVTRC